MTQRRVIVVNSAALDIQRRNRWWRKNRKGAPLLLAESLRAAYAALQENAGLGSPFESQDVEGVFRYQIQATRHSLFYVVRERPPLPSYVVILGIQGPGEAGPPDLAKASQEI